MPCTRRALAILWLATQAAHAQSADTVPAVPPSAIGGPVEDGLRQAHLRGAPTTGWLLRTSTAFVGATRTLSRPTPFRSPCELLWEPIVPVVSATWNSALPVARNDGGSWAGRGLTMQLAGGARATCGRVRVQVAPSLWFAENRGFPVLPSGNSDRSGFASPFHSTPSASADIPSRFGTESILMLDPGETAVEVTVGRAVVGAGTQSRWWGPGVRNALVMSNHAAGIPSFYLATASPWRLRPLGDIEAHWMVGALTESPYFDRDARNDLRSLSGLVGTFRPRIAPQLTVGGARVVYAPIPGAGALPARFFDAIARWGEGVDTRAATAGRASEQLSTLFFRWVFPRNGTEVYGEWARQVLPNSLRSFLVSPNEHQAYTLGLQWLGDADVSGRSWRLQWEATQVEQPARDHTTPAESFYVSPVVAQGFTQRGQVIGALIGPGSSSQFAAIDRLGGAFTAGLFAGRVRWQSDAYYRQPTGEDRYAHDVSLFGGVRGGMMAGPAHWGFELLVDERHNYLFQNRFLGHAEDDTYDIRNVSLRIVVSPRSGR